MTSRGPFPRHVRARPRLYQVSTDPQSHATHGLPGALPSPWGTPRTPQASCCHPKSLQSLHGEPSQVCPLLESAPQPSESRHHAHPRLSCPWAFLQCHMGSSCHQMPPHLSPGSCALSPARGMGVTARPDQHTHQLRTHRQGQHVGERPRAVEHQVELCGRHPAEHGGCHGPKMPSHFLLQSPESKNHAKSEDCSD